MIIFIFPLVIAWSMLRHFFLGVGKKVPIFTRIISFSLQKITHELCFYRLFVYFTRRTFQLFYPLFLERNKTRYQQNCTVFKYSMRQKMSLLFCINSGFYAHTRPILNGFVFCWSIHFLCTFSIQSMSINPITLLVVAN